MPNPFEVPAASAEPSYRATLADPCTAIGLTGPANDWRVKGSVFRRPFVPADDMDEVWNAQNVTGPDSGPVAEARFCSISDPGALASSLEGWATEDHVGQFTELRFSAPRGISLRALEDGVGITCEEHGEGVGQMVGEASGSDCNCSEDRTTPPRISLAADDPGSKLSPILKTSMSYERQLA